MTKVTLNKKAANELKAYESNVQVAADALRAYIDAVYPNAADGSLGYARARKAENEVWRSDKDYEFQVGKAAEAQEKLLEAEFIQRAINEQQEREQLTDPHKVYSTGLERAKQWAERMEMQLYGAKVARDAAHQVLENIAD